MVLSLVFLVVSLLACVLSLVIDSFRCVDWVARFCLAACRFVVAWVIFVSFLRRVFVSSLMVCDLVVFWVVDASVWAVFVLILVDRRMVVVLVFVVCCSVSAFVWVIWCSEAALVFVICFVDLWLVLAS